MFFECVVDIILWQRRNFCFAQVKRSAGRNQRLKNRFDPLSGLPQPHRDNCHKPSSGDADAVSPTLREHIHHVQQEILRSSASVVRLKEECDQFINHMRDSFSQTGKRIPDLLYLQLVDHDQNIVRTVRGYGMPLSFEYMPGHALDSGDIQVAVVNNCQIELIVGIDPRFDMRVHRQYRHENYTRLWFPLFPFPDMPCDKDAIPSLEARLREWLHWERREDSSMKGLVGTWDLVRQPPTESVYGTVEIGFLKNNMGTLDLDPLNQEMAIWTMARAYAAAPALFSATLAGVKERVSRLGNSLNSPCTAISDIPFAMQEETDEMIRETTATAAHLFHGVVYPQELLVPDTDPSHLGTLMDDKNVIAVCEEAGMMTGAVGCLLYFFSDDLAYHRKKENDKPWRIRPATSWCPIGTGRPSPGRYEDKAREVARDRVSKYMVDSSSSGEKLVLLPLELSGDVSAVLTIILHETDTLSKTERRLDLERRVPRWVYRLSIHRLIQQNRFIALVAEFRRYITEAKDVADKKTIDPAAHTSATCVRIFLLEFLKSIVNRLGLPVAWFTLHHPESSTGPSRLERFWYVDEGGEDRCMFFQSELSGPCKEACEQKEPIIYSDQNKKGKLEELISRLKGQASHLEETDEYERSCKLREFIACLRRESGTPTSTMLTFPVTLRGETTPQFQAACTFILPGDHWYEKVHRKELGDLGETLAETLDHVRHIDRRRYEKRFHQSYEDLRRTLVTKSTIDGIYGALLRELRLPKEGEEDDRSLSWRLSRDIVVWQFSADYKHLAFRSACGEAFTIFEKSPSRMVFPAREHPLLRTQDIFFFPKKGPPRLTARFFPFKTFRLDGNREATNKDLSDFYREQTEKKWLVTFPLIDVNDQIIGIVDCLRDFPHLTEKEAELQQFLPRTAMLFCSAVKGCHVDLVARETKEIFDLTERHLRRFKTQEVYRDLAGRLRDFFHCEHADLFLDHEGEMILTATTREGIPLSRNKRYDYWVRSNADERRDEPLSAALRTGRIQLRHGSGPSSYTTTPHLSTDLQRLLAPADERDRIAIPLKSPTRGDRIGLVHLDGPKPRPKEKGEGMLKRSLLFTMEDMKLAEDLSPQIQRIVRMVRLMEQQEWLVTQLVHSFGQPLQFLRSTANQMLDALAENDCIDEKKISIMAEEIDKGFRLITEAKEHLSFLGRLGETQGAYRFDEVNLKDLIDDCCAVTMQRAYARTHLIACKEVRPIPDVPIVQFWMRWAILNLLENACKYSWHGKEIHVRYYEDSNGNITIKVTNLGIGIPSELKDRIFEPYFRARVPDHREIRQGTGVGLAIVREAIEVVHEGKARCVSMPVSGSDSPPATTETIADRLYQTTFTISLSRATLARLAAQPADLSGGANG